MSAIRLKSPGQKVRDAAYCKRWYAAHREEALAYQKAYRKANPEKIRKQRRAGREKNREKIQLQKKAYRETHRERLREKQKKYWTEHREELNARRRAQDTIRYKEALAKHRIWFRKRKFGLSANDVNDLLDKQNGVCAICHKATWNKKGPCIDHDHASGKVRGILCYACNSALGFIKDDLKTLKSMMDYLRANKQVARNG